MTCTFVARRRCRQAVSAAQSHECVSAADVLQPGAGAHDGWSVSFVLYGSMIPPEIASVLSAAELALDPDATGTRGEPAQVELVATLS